LGNYLLVCDFHLFDIASVWFRVPVRGGIFMICPADHSHSNYCYTHHKCRCDVCRAKRSAYARKKYGSMSVEDRKEYNSRRRVSAKVLKVQFADWQLAVAERVLNRGNE